MTVVLGANESSPYAGIIYCIYSKIGPTMNNAGPPYSKFLPTSLVCGTLEYGLKTLNIRVKKMLTKDIFVVISGLLLSPKGNKLRHVSNPSHSPTYMNFDNE